MPDLERQALGLGKRPALILVDMINGFTDPACPLGSDADDVVDACAELLGAFRARLLPVYFTTVVYHDASQARVFRQRLPALEVLQADSHWIEVDARLAPSPREPVIEKQWASAFFATDLDQRLQHAGVDSLVVCGLTTSGCVRATAVDGLQYEYPVVIAEQAVGDRNQTAHQANLADLDAKYADVMKLERLIQIIQSLETTNESVAGTQVQPKLGGRL
jgi:nicotinamidase-related amidase